MNKWLSDEEIDLLRDDIRHKNCQTCQDEQKVSDQAHEANRLRAGLETLCEASRERREYYDEKAGKLESQHAVDILPALKDGDSQATRT